MQDISCRSQEAEQHEECDVNAPEYERDDLDRDSFGANDEVNEEDWNDPVCHVNRKPSKSECFRP